MPLKRKGEAWAQASPLRFKGMRTCIGGDAQNDAQKCCKMQPQVATLMRSLSLVASESLVFA